MARPLKLEDPDCREKLLLAIRGGNYYEAACGFAGISYETLRRWRRRGEAEETRVAASGRRRVRKREAIFVELVADLRLAEAEAEIRMVNQWQRAMQVPSHWQAIRDFLQRRHPDRWGRQRIDLAIDEDVRGHVTYREILVPPPLQESQEEGKDGGDAVAEDSAPER